MFPTSLKGERGGKGERQRDIICFVKTCEEDEGRAVSLSPRHVFRAINGDCFSTRKDLRVRARSCAFFFFFSFCVRVRDRPSEFVRFFVCIVGRMCICEYIFCYSVTMRVIAYPLNQLFICQILGNYC